LFINIYNWLSIIRAVFVIVNPIAFFFAIINRKKLDYVKVRTPIGIIDVEMRNFESMRTFYTMFCRLDYFIENDKIYSIMDCGSNIGLSSLYFLSRNASNTVTCFEPDKENLKYLHRNLARFSDRVSVHEVALSTSSGSGMLYRSKDGKYSSLLPSERTGDPDSIECIKFEGALVGVANKSNLVIVKMDVEGLEIDLIGSVRWENFPNVVSIFSESAGCSDVISRQHSLHIRNGMLEVVDFG
jgi:FkbM family methyltransferase